MPVGRSGRIVVEFDPELKRRLHARLRSEGRDFKGWLLERVQEYLEAPRDSRGAPRSSEEPPSELGELEQRVFDAVSTEARARHHVDDLVEATGLGIGEVQKALLQLELQGRVVQDLGLYRRVRPS
jgi:predicted Rossmann fold nucleotide-binding protein DprA/Smf involved in DNA uptake